MNQDAPVAAIDCGTNSIRLLIARPAPGGGLTDLERHMEIVRLGQGVDRTGRFDPAAVDRTLDAARRYARLIEHHGAERLRFTATSATRDASNRDLFISGIREILGVDPEVISGDEEAELSFRGAVTTLGLGRRDGWDTAFVAERPGVAKTHDLNVRKRRSRWAVECKRMDRSSYEAR